MQTHGDIFPSLQLPPSRYMRLRRHVTIRTRCSPLRSYWKPVDHRLLDTSLLDNMRTDGTVFRDAVHLSDGAIRLKARPSSSRDLPARIWRAACVTTLELSRQPAHTKGGYV